MVQDKLPHGRVGGQTWRSIERRFCVTAIVDAFNEEMASSVQVLFQIFRGLLKVHDLEAVVRWASPKNHRGHSMFRIGKRFDQRTARTAGKNDDGRKVIATEASKLAREKRSGTDTRASDAFFVDVELRRDAREHVIEEHEFFVHARWALRDVKRPFELAIAFGFWDHGNETLRIGCQLDLSAIVEVVGASTEPMPQEEDRQSLVGFHVNGQNQAEITHSVTAWKNIVSGHQLRARASRVFLGIRGQFRAGGRCVITRRHDVFVVRSATTRTARTAAAGIARAARTRSATSAAHIARTARSRVAARGRARSGCCFGDVAVAPATISHHDGCG